MIYFEEFLLQYLENGICWLKKASYQLLFKNNDHQSKPKSKKIWPHIIAVVFLRVNPSNLSSPVQGS